MKLTRVKGTRDFYPEDMFRRRWMEDIWRKVSLRNGFEEYDGPIMEHLELFTAKSGQEIVEQLFNLTDRGGRALAIRPEITPTLARMVNARAASLPRPIRWFSIPRLCRGEQPQRGRLREFFQWNYDILGVIGPLADAESIFVAIDMLREVGLGPEDVVVRISSRAMLAAMLTEAGFSSEQVSLAYHLLDKRAKLEENTFQALAAEVVTDKKALATLQMVSSYRTLDEIQGGCVWGQQTAAAIQDLADVFAKLEVLGVAEYCCFDIGIVRGLAYYTGTVFEIFDRAGQLRAIGGGGRYDDLLKVLGGPEMPAVGFGMGDVVLCELLAERKLLPQYAQSTDYYVIDADNGLFDKVLDITSKLRRRGLSVQFSYKRLSLGKQLKAATAVGARRCAIIGQEPSWDGMITVKDMADGRQISMPVEEFLADPWKAVE